MTQTDDDIPGLYIVLRPLPETWRGWQWNIMQIHPKQDLRLFSGTASTLFLAAAQADANYADVTTARRQRSEEKP